MHSYSFHIGDYRSDTVHLGIVEHYIYRSLIDLCFLNERPLENNLRKLGRLIRLEDESQYETLKNILDEFFVLTDDGYINKRVSDELSQIYEKSEKARESAKKRWDRHANKNTDAMPTHSERNAEAMLPITHNPLPNNPLPNNPNTSSSKTSDEVFSEEDTHSTKKTRASPKRELTELEILKAHGIEGQVARDFLKNRKAKKLPLTQTAMDGIAEEAARAELSVLEAVTISASNGWGSFKAKWDWQSDGTKSGGNGARASPPASKFQVDYGEYEPSEDKLNAMKTIDGEVIRDG